MLPPQGGQRDSQVCWVNKDRTLFAIPHVAAFEAVNAIDNDTRPTSSTSPRTSPVPRQTGARDLRA
jgi:hypothetical protein